MDKFGDSIIDRIKRSRAMAGGKRTAIFKDDFDGLVYKPDYGKHLIDIIPYLAGNMDTAKAEGEGTYTFSYLMHYTGPAKTEVICPTMYKKPCPICELLSTLKKGNKEHEEIYSVYKLKPRNLYNVIVLSDKEQRRKGIQILDQPEFYFEKGLRSIAVQAAREGEDERIVNFAHPKRGKSIQFETIKKKGEDGFDTWTGHTFQDRGYKIDQAILDKAYILDQVVKVLSYDEIKDILDGSLAIDRSNQNTTYQSSHSQATSASDSKEPDYGSILRKVFSEADDNDDLEDLSDINNLEDYGFEGIIMTESFDSQKRKLIEYLESKISGTSQNSSTSQSTSTEFDREAILAKIKSSKDNDDLEEIVDFFDLEELGFSEIKESEDFTSERIRLKRFVKKYEPKSEKKEETVFINKDEVLSALKKAKTISAIEEIIEKFRLAYHDSWPATFDKNNGVSEERVKIKKFIKSLPDAQHSQKPSNVMTEEKINNMVWEELKAFAKENYSEKFDVDFYDDPEDEIDDLREEVLKYFNEIPF